jgi:hypothetical protein
MNTDKHLVARIDEVLAQIDEALNERARAQRRAALLRSRKAKREASAAASGGHHRDESAVEERKSPSGLAPSVPSRRRWPLDNQETC